MSNPFENVQAVFAADLEPVRHEFTLYERPCYVVLQPMDSDAHARYDSVGQSILVDVTKRTVESARVDMDLANAELELLLGTVTEYQFVMRKKARTGEWAYELTTGTARASRDTRIATFKSLAHPFRKLLVAECLKVNGLGPLALAEGSEAPGAGGGTSE